MPATSTTAIGLAFFTSGKPRKRDSAAARSSPAGSATTKNEVKSRAAGTDARDSPGNSASNVAPRNAEATRSRLGIPSEAEGDTPVESRELGARFFQASRSEEHTSELQSLRHLVCRLLLEKKK